MFYVLLMIAATFYAYDLLKEDCKAHCWWKLGSHIALFAAIFLLLSQLALGSA